MGEDDHGRTEAVAALERDTEGHLPAVLIDVISGMSETPRAGSVSVRGGTASSRGRRRSDATLRLVARSLAARTAGLATVAADEFAASQAGVLVENVTIYRMRLRSDLDKRRLLPLGAFRTPLGSERA